MKKHKVFFIGSKNYTTTTEEEAIKLAEQDIKNLHPSFNLDISGVRDDDNKMQLPYRKKLCRSFNLARTETLIHISTIYE